MAAQETPSNPLIMLQSVDGLNHDGNHDNGIMSISTGSVIRVRAPVVAAVPLLLARYKAQGLVPEASFKCRFDINMRLRKETRFEEFNRKRGAYIAATSHQPSLLTDGLLADRVRILEQHVAVLLSDIYNDQNRPVLFPCPVTGTSQLLDINHIPQAQLLALRLCRKLLDDEMFFLPPPPYISSIGVRFVSTNILGVFQKRWP